ncbi:sulfite exporter TauE/SafE family protein [Nocardioides coralli]|nr:sulfite exporter TauE/SafE family protein [Nocardioides coralli]
MAGLGMGLVTAPLVAIVAPELMPALPLWFGLLISGSATLLDHRHVDWSAIRWILPARALGTLPGVWLVVVFTSDQLGLVLATVVIMAVLVSWRTLQVPVNPGTMVTAGFLGGVGGTATSIAGPPVAILFQHGRPAEVRATLAVYFFGGVLMSLGALGVAGELPVASVWVALLCAPLVGLGLWLGTRTRDRLPREQFRRAVLLVSAVSALALVAKSVA